MVQCAMCTVSLAADGLTSVLSTLWNIQCAVWCAKCSTVHCALYTVHCAALCIVNCTLFTVQHCALCIVYRALCSPVQPPPIVPPPLLFPVIPLPPDGPSLSLWLHSNAPLLFHSPRGTALHFPTLHPTLILGENRVGYRLPKCWFTQRIGYWDMNMCA